MSNDKENNCIYYSIIFTVGGCSASKEIPNDFVTPCPGVGCDFN